MLGSVLLLPLPPLPCPSHGCGAPEGTRGGSGAAPPGLVGLGLDRAPGALVQGLMLPLSFCVWCVTGDGTLADGTRWGVEGLAAPQPQLQVQNDPGMRQWLHPWTLSARQIIGLSISVVLSDSAAIGRSQIPHGIPVAM